MSQIDKHLDDGDKGDYDELRKDAVDPSYTPDPNNPNKSKFLIWTRKKTKDGIVHEATGFDGTYYVIKEDDVTVKKGKVEVKAGGKPADPDVIPETEKKTAIKEKQNAT